MASVMGEYPVKIFKGCVQHYGWGGYDFIPQIMGRENAESEPFAELWMGVHPACPSITEDGELLIDFLEKNPGFLGGSHLALPFLCKVLDVRDMLSIQLHPDIEKAQLGFDDEKSKGIPITAFERTYKDPNHKPELMYALSDFYLLHGFREEGDLIGILSEKDALRWVKDTISEMGLEKFYCEFMQKEQEEINALLNPLLDELEKSADTYTKDHPDYWAYKAFQTFCTPGWIDRGLLSIYLLNLVYLRKGEVIFQGAGIPHAYLEGQNVEVMSNSDNVIRGGLTKKYINYQSLIELVNFEDRSISLLTGSNEFPHLREFENFVPPVRDFKLSVLRIRDENIDTIIRTEGIAILFVLEGKVELEAMKRTSILSAGEGALLAAKSEIAIKFASAKKIFLVSTN
ncbi:mannose-6-phosphate isomerase, class I [Membranihabitans maritimus]|uniref:mannose-6-phosphate isomerase, class I n=1 Tax=Membranihabitans maritimus TaxID=2904244 RepID=UPI001F01E3C1|nr:mannose-6-phosphate isomerase, class I [Membranihabitans maritimus]